MSRMLYYLHDPMCSWCWGFAPVWRQIRLQLPNDLPVQYLLGGLAADTDQPMPTQMRSYLQQTWHTIAEQLGTPFNFDFWSQCQPRRATYPACRAVIAAEEQAAEMAMIDAIQRAYYLEAQNPSDNTTLRQLAMQLGLDDQRFTAALNAERTQRELDRQIALTRSLGAQGFPSLIYAGPHGTRLIPHDYQDPSKTLAAITVLHQQAGASPD